MPQPSQPDTTRSDGNNGQYAQVSLCSLPPFLSAELLANATPNHPVSGVALVVRSHLRTDRHQRPYVALTLRYADTTITEARWWQFPYSSNRCPLEGAVYGLTGWTETFNGTRQLRITDAHLVPDADLAPFAPSIHRPVAELLAELDDRVAQLDGPLAALVRQVLSGDTLTRFSTWPAAQYKHGAVRHGLLAHSLRVAALADALAAPYGSADFPCDHSLITAASLLHDVGKIHTLPPIAGLALPPLALYLDHVTLGALAVQSAADHLDVPIATERLKSLLHIILAHHGHTQWGAPIEPQSVEAWLVHLADYAESRLWRFTDEVPQSADAAADHV